MEWSSLIGSVYCLARDYGMAALSVVFGTVLVFEIVKGIIQLRKESRNV
jgi:hypothetical protein